MKNFAYSLMAKSIAISSAFFVAFNNLTMKRVEAACPPGQYAMGGTSCTAVTGGDAGYNTVKNNLSGDFSYIYNTIATIMLSIAICFIVYSGYLYMTSAGNPEKLGQAKKLLLGSGIGIIVIASSYTLYKFFTGLMV